MGVHRAWACCYTGTVPHPLDDPIPMKLKDLAVDTVVEFTDQIEPFGVYAEKGIRAKIAFVEQRDSETLAVWFDYTDFTEHNQTVESPFYGPEGGLTATQAGRVPAHEELFFDLEEPAATFVILVDPAPSPSRSSPRP